MANQLRKLLMGAVLKLWEECNHTVDSCYAKTTVDGDAIPSDADEHCSRCGRSGHLLEECDAETTASGEKIPDCIIL